MLDRLILRNRSEEVRKSIANRVRDRSVTGSMKERLRAVNLILTLEAKQSCLPNTDFESSAKRAGRRLRKMLLDSDPPAELLPERGRIRVGRQILKFRNIEVASEFKHGDR
jgi:hypothetical protein